ncbi:hypothetical protein Tco_0944414 [Tanacetum coccineum]
MLSFLKRYNGIMFTHDPKSAKMLKGFESPNRQGRVNSLESSILVDTSPWTNPDPFCLVLSFPRIYPLLRYRLERGLGLREPVGVIKIVLLWLKSVPLTSRFVDLTWGSDSVHLSRLRRGKVSFHQALDLILELDEAARARSSNNAQDSSAFRSRSLPPADWLMVHLVTGLTWS